MDATYVFVDITSSDIEGREDNFTALVKETAAADAGKSTQDVTVNRIYNESASMRHRHLHSSVDDQMLADVTVVFAYNETDAAEAYESFVSSGNATRYYGTLDEWLGDVPPPPLSPSEDPSEKYGWPKECTFCYDKMISDDYNCYDDPSGTAFQEKSDKWEGDYCCAMISDDCFNQNQGAVAGLVIGVIICIAAAIYVSNMYLPFCPLYGKLPFGPKPAQSGVDLKTASPPGFSAIDNAIAIDRL